MSRRESWEEAEEKDVEYLEEARAVSSSIGGERPIPGTGSAHAGALKKPRMSLKLACVPPAAWSVQASSEADKDVCADSRAIGAIGATEATDDFSLDSYTPQRILPTVGIAPRSTLKHIDLHPPVAFDRPRDIARPSHWQAPPHASYKARASSLGVSVAPSRAKPPAKSTRRTSLQLNPLRPPVPVANLSELAFRPSWLPRPPSLLPSQSNQAATPSDDIVEDKASSPVMGAASQTPMRHSKAWNSSFASTSPASSGKRHSSARSNGPLRSQLAKLSRRVESDELRMLNKDSFADGSIIDPRTKARVWMDIRILSAAMTHISNFIAYDVVIRNVESKDTMLDAHLLDAVGAPAVAYFKLKNSIGAPHRVTEETVIRLYDAVLAASSSIASVREVLCTEIAEIV